MPLTKDVFAWIGLFACLASLCVVFGYALADLTQREEEAMGLKFSGFCWFCGLPITSGLFCDGKCHKKYERKKVLDDRKAVKTGKREGYGLAGSTH